MCSVVGMIHEFSHEAWEWVGRGFSSLDVLSICSGICCLGFHFDEFHNDFVGRDGDVVFCRLPDNVTVYVVDFGIWPR